MDFNEFNENMMKLIMKDTFYDQERGENEENKIKRLEIALQIV